MCGYNHGIIVLADKYGSSEYLHLPEQYFLF
jgi:hypothetical protein